MCSAKTLDIKGKNAKLLGPNKTCWALQLKMADYAPSMYIGNQNKQIWAPITYIGPGPEVLSSDRPTIYNHAPWAHVNSKKPKSIFE